MELSINFYFEAKDSCRLGCFTNPTPHSSNEYHCLEWPLSLNEVGGRGSLNGALNFYFEAKDRMKNILFDLLSPTLSSNFVGGEGAFSAEAEPSPALYAGKRMSVQLRPVVGCFTNPTPHSSNKYNCLE